MSSSYVSLNRPKDWQAFERLTCDLFSAIHKTKNFDQYGRNGQRQHGIDIFGEAGPKRLRIGIQCKGRQAYGKANAISEKDIVRAVEYAKTIDPKLDRLVFVTTGPNDAKTKDLVAAITEQHRMSGLFDVEFYAWNWFERQLAQFPDLAIQYGLLAKDSRASRRIVLALIAGAIGAVLLRLGIENWRDSKFEEENAQQMAVMQEQEQLGQLRLTLFNWDIAFSGYLNELRVMRFPQPQDGICATSCSIWELRRFYGAETNPGVLDGFKSNFEQIGSLGSDIVNANVPFPTSFDRAAFVGLIEYGKALNNAIDQSQEAPPGLSLGQQLGFNVNGSPDTWIRFYQTVPRTYEIYIGQAKRLFAAYCTDFRPKAKQLLKDVEKAPMYSTDLSKYQDPCTKTLPWDNFVEGTPAFVLEKLKHGLR